MIVTVPNVTSVASKAPFNTAFKVYTLLISSLVVVYVSFTSFPLGSYHFVEAIVAPLAKV